MCRLRLLTVGLQAGSNSERRGAMECVECRARYPQACGRKVFVEATCSVCLELTKPFVLLPCGHGCCEQDFSRMGGLIKDQIPSAPQATSLDTSADVVEYVDTNGCTAAFRLDGQGCLNYYEAGQLKVRALSRLVLRGRNLTLEGVSAGPWPSEHVSTVPRGCERVAQCAVELFDRYGVTRQVAGDGRYVAEEGYFDADGICVAFRLEGLGCVNYYKGGQLKVHTLTSLARRHRTLYLSGASAGPWGDSCISQAPSGSVAQRAVELFEQRHATL